MKSYRFEIHFNRLFVHNAYYNRSPLQVRENYMKYPKKFLGLMALIGFMGFLVTSALANSPSVTVLPATVPTNDITTITITAAVTNTVISSISASGPNGNLGPWTWSG